MTSQLRVGSFGSALKFESDKSDYLCIAAESLLHPDPNVWESYMQRIGDENARIISIGSKVIGGLTFYPVAQWFGGETIPMAAVSGVAIDPSHRGGGVCETLLRQSMSEWRQSGIPIACLYASTQRLYRKVGFQQAGSRIMYSLPIASFDAPAKERQNEISIKRFRQPPVESLMRVADKAFKKSNGNLLRNAGLWERLMSPTDNLPTITYIIGDLDDPIGYAIMKAGTRDGGFPATLVASDICLTNAESIDRVIRLVRDHRSMCNEFQWYSGPQDSLLMAAAEQNVKVVDHMRWLLRILDVHDALSARGYPPGVTVELDIEISDDVIEENNGTWRLSVKDGKGLVEKAERPSYFSLTMDIRTLAPLFSSFRSASQLAQVGLIETIDESQLAIADQVFAGPAPWMSEIF